MGFFYLSSTVKVLHALYTRYGASLGACRVTQFQPGSIVATYEVGFQGNADVTAADIRTQLVEAFASSDDPALTRLGVDAESFTVTSTSVLNNWTKMGRRFALKCFKHRLC